MVAGGGLSTLGPWAGRVRRKLQASRRPPFSGPRRHIAAHTTWAAVSPALGASGRRLAARQRSLNQALRIQTHGHARPIQSEAPSRGFRAASTRSRPRHGRGGAGGG